jgi:hypothetical protein
MPQLIGREIGRLHNLLVDHTNVELLSRALEFHNLPRLDEIARPGDLRYTIHEVVTKLSQRYRIVELVEAVLSELDDHCPPLQEWLETHRADLIRRRDDPNLWEKIPDIIRLPWLRYVAGLILAGLLLVMTALGISYVLAPASSMRCEIYDEWTKERIKREFTIKDSSRSYGGKEDRFAVVVPVEFLSRPDELRFVCDGYEERPESDFLSKDTNGRGFYLKRRSDYIQVFCKAARRELTLGSLAAEAIADREGPHLPPTEVTVLVDNQTDFHPDIVFLHFLPEDESQFDEGPSCFRISSHLIPKRQRTSYNPFTIGRMVCAVFVSLESELPPMLIHEGAVLTHKFMEITIHEDRHKHPGIEFSDDDPRFQ